jgi:hypothetical protein
MSGENVPYHLRPNKFVERALFVELLTHVNAVQPIPDYLYVGFGGPYLEDFKVLHQQFGIKHMLSLEQEAWVHQRQQFNIPYSCVKCRNQTSGEFLADYDEAVRPYGKKRKVLIWLDYAQANGTRRQLNEIRDLTPHLRLYDMLKVTLNANPNTLASEQGLAVRLQGLQQRLGDLLPEGITENEVTKEEYPKVLLRTLERTIKNGMSETKELMLQPLATFVYADSPHQMLTFSGIVIRRDDDGAFLRGSRIQTLDFATTNWKDYQRIDVPFLSVREKLLIDSALFNRRKSKQPPKRLTDKITLANSRDKTRKLIKTYGQFYRFYPHFHRIHY